MDILTTNTGFPGSLQDIRIISLDDWSSKYFRPVKALMSTVDIKETRCIAGQWIGQLKTNDEHLFHFFKENFAASGSEPRPDIFCYAFTQIDNKDFLKAFHDIRSKTDIDRLLHKTSLLLSQHPRKEKLSDPDLIRFKEITPEEKVSAVLRQPSAIFVPDLNVFVMVNVDSYQVLRNQGFFGALKRFVLSRVQLEVNGDIGDTSRIWLPLNASVVEMANKENDFAGVAFLSTDAALKASLAINLTDQVPGTKFVSSELVYANLESKEVVPIEKSPYIHGSVIAEHIGLLPHALSTRIENLRLDGDTAEFLDRAPSSAFRNAMPDRTVPNEIASSLMASLSEEGVFSLFDPQDYWSNTDVSTSTILDTVFIVTRNYEDNRVLTTITREEAVRILTAEDNVLFYEDAGQTPHAMKKACSQSIPWFDDHIIESSPAADEDDIAKTNSLMRRMLDETIHFSLLNARIPLRQLSFCIISYISGTTSSVSLKPYEEADKVLCANLRLIRKTRRVNDMEASYLHSPDGRVVNILSFTKSDGTTSYAAFDAEGTERNQVKSYSKGTVADFFARHSDLPVRRILGHVR